MYKACKNRFRLQSITLFTLQRNTHHLVNFQSGKKKAPTGRLVFYNRFRCTITVSSYQCLKSTRIT